MLTLNKIQKELAIIPNEVFASVEQNIDGRIPHRHIEILYALRKIMDTKCETYLEIGVHNGGSMGIVMQYPSPCYCVGVDMFKEVLNIPRYQYFASDNLSLEKTTQNLDRVNKWNHHWEIVEGNSCHTTTIEAVKQKVSNVDLFFIDGDHSYDGVKADFENYSPLVSSGGVIVFDDYKPGNHPEIVKFVDEINDPDWIKIGTVPNEFILQRK